MHPVLLAGFGLMLVGVAFKLSLVPFHSWAPDVYEGAPLPIAAFFSTVSKTAMLAFVLRLFAVRAGDGVAHALALLAILSMLGGNLLALRQTHVRRLLAYSSSAHMGYALVPLVVGGRGAAVATTAYLAAYVLTSLAAFGALAAVLAREPGRESEGRLDLRGLRTTQPWLCVVLGVALMSLAGMPLTAGFFGKFVVLSVGARGAAWVTLAALAIASVIGAYYYIRVLIETCAPLPQGARCPGARSRPAGEREVVGDRPAARPPDPLAPVLRPLPGLGADHPRRGARPLTPAPGRNKKRRGFLPRHFSFAVGPSPALHPSYARSRMTLW